MLPTISPRNISVAISAGDIVVPYAAALLFPYSAPVHILANLLLHETGTSSSIVKIMYLPVYFI